MGVHHLLHRTGRGTLQKGHEDELCKVLVAALGEMDTSASSRVWLSHHHLYWCLTIARMSVRVGPQKPVDIPALVTISSNRAHSTQGTLASSQHTCLHVCMCVHTCIFYLFPAQACFGR